MGKNKLSSGLINVVTYDTDSNISLNSGSNLLMSLSGSGTVTIPGNLIVGGGIAGSTAESSSYALNADKIDNLDSTQLVLTSSFNSYTSSATSNLNSLSGSVATTTSDLSSSVGSLSSSIATTTLNLSSSVSSSIGGLSGSIVTTTNNLSGRISTVEGNYATTGSNIFSGNQTITGSICATGNIVTTGQIVAQTINVQQVTSSIVYSCGSNVFGTNINNTQTFTGSLQVTGSTHYLMGNVGIGTNNPYSTLTVGSGDSTATISPGGSNTHLTIKTLGASGAFRVYTIGGSTGVLSTTESFRVDAGGNVGVGTLSPSYKFEVCGPGETINIIGASSGDVATGFRIGRGASLGAQIYDNPQDNITTINTTGGLNLRTGGSGRLSISSTGISCFSCQVCTPHLVVLNNVSIGSSCTSTDGYNTRLRITNIANDTFVFAINNQACRPIMFMYGGNTNNPHGYTAWLDNTSGLQNHSLSHITTESTYFAAQGGRVGIGTTSANTKFEVVGGSQCTPGTNTSNYTMALRDPTSMVCGVGGSILLQGYKTGTAAIGNFAYIAGKKENGTAGNEAGYLALGTFDSAGLAYERVKITSAGTVIFNCNSSYCSNYGYNFLGVCNGSMLSGAHIMGNVGVDACATPFWCNGGNFRMEFNWSSGTETQWINHNNCAPFKLLWSADNYANKYCFGYNGNFWASNSVYATTLNAGSVLTVGSIGHYQNYINTSGCFAIFCASQGAILYVTSMHNNGRSTAIVSYANGVTAGAAISIVNQVTPYGPASLSFGVCANGWVYGYSQYGGPMDFYAISMNSTFTWGF